MSEIIGKGTWLDKLASKIISREKELKRSLSLIRVESGLGASGIPHIGSLGDAVRAYGIKLALENMGYKSELIAYSDDMDGLRKVPKGLPEDMVKYISFPVSRIPDPYKCHSSYGEHMSSLLLEALDKSGIQYRFQSAQDAYKKGLLTEEIVKILENSKIIGEVIKERLNQEKFLKVLPYFPICENCGRIYLANAKEFIEDEYKILYKCEGAQISKRWIEGCNHEGEMDIRRGEGKLSWKGEFAARWKALDIRFEAYGKDIADSVKINDWISDNILNFPHPYHVQYEMFLDKKGKKISKSIGGSLTPQLWLKYATPQSLLLLLYKRIIGIRRIGLEDIPRYMDEYDRLEDIYFGRIKLDNPAKEIKLKGIYEYINHLKPPKEPSTHVPYNMLVDLASVAPEEGSIDFIVNRLKSYRILKGEADEGLIKRILLCLEWAKDFKRGLTRKIISLGEKEKKALWELREVLKWESDAQKIQNYIFEIAKKNQIEPPSFFTLLYRILLNSDRGPRLGPYIVDIGREKVIETIDKQIERD
ncbi:MAG: lysine--tRNA ligase [Nitrososphaerales archaeon]